METPIYFFISYPRTIKEKSGEINFISQEKNKKPECIHQEEIYENSMYYYKKIFMVNKLKPKGKKANKYHYEFIINEDKYIISFENKDNIFIYDVVLETGKKILDIKWKIDQSKIDYYDKMEFFIEALEKKGDKNLIDDLYKDTITLYSNKKRFSLLISLFLKIYKKKDLCSDLLKLFNKMNNDPNDHEKNMDRKAYLKNFTSDFDDIKSEADSLINTNNYDSIEFYGILLCFFNYYDYENFSSLLSELFNKKPNVLYEILLIYNAHFKYPIKHNFMFFNDFIKYTINNKDFKIFQCGLNYIKDIFTFINIFEINKGDIFNKYTQKSANNIIKLDDNLKFQINESEETYNDDNERPINIIIKKIRSIIDFCDSNNTFLIYFTNNFWKNLLNYYNEPKQDNILICYNLRELFILYHDLVVKIFAKKAKKFTIKNEAVNYFEIDEFAFLLDQMIKKYLSENKELESIEKLSFITKYNPYYTDSKYYNQVNSDIFDLLDLNHIDKDFIEHFRRMNFELIFKENISEYINKIFSKINNTSDFGTIIDLITIERLEDKNSFLDSMKKKYDKIIINEIGSLEGAQLNKAIKVVSKLAIINYIFEIDKKKNSFMNNKMRKLDKKIIPLIYIEIMKQCLKLEKEKESTEGKNEEESKIIDFKELKNFIFDKFANKLDDANDIDNIINLIDVLEGKFDNQKDKNDKKEEDSLIEIDSKINEENINEFLKKLMEKNLFTKEEYFSGNQNIKISLLYKLYEKGKIKKSEEDYYDKIQDLIKSIKEDIEGKIQKKTLEEFLRNDESFIKQRLSLINLIIELFNPEEAFNSLKKINEEINKEIKRLIFIKDNIIIYHRDVYQEIIKRLIEIIKNNQNKKISDYKGGKEGKGGNIHEFLTEIKANNLEEIAEKVDKVKNFLLFNVIFEMNAGKDEEKNFNDAFQELNEIGEEINGNNDINKLYNNYKKYFDKIREKLSNNEERAKNFIKDFINYYDIKNKNLENGLIILFKSIKFELDINSMIFFFGYFQKDNKDWNDKLSPEKYENLSKKNFEEIKKNLEELKIKKIYDYNNVKNYNKLFTCLYDKSEAIDFLFSKTTEDMNILKDRIQPNDRILSVKDIEDTERCIIAINRMKKLEDNNKIFKYIMAMNDEIIGQFENYSKNFASVIELDRNDDISENVYEQVNNIIKDATFNILQDYEEFIYYNEKEKKSETIEMKDLIHLKNKIHNETIKGNEDEKMKEKCEVLIFFKRIISNLEVINEYMDVLRTKGSSLPIKITIKINKIQENKPTIKYYLADNLKDFLEIREFLFNAKNKYISQLDDIYKKELNIRFLFGRQFRSIMKHIESDLNIESFLRYILNNKNNNEIIKDGYKAKTMNVTDWVKFYGLYNQNSLDSISSYITSLFKHNKIELEDHYNKMRIITASDNVYKGIFLHECKDDSMEEYILNLFWDKTNQLPIAQNVLITNKETSSEEIQAFFHRAILCNYNTLFVVEINDSFNNYQQSIMNSYLDKLLTYKNDIYNENNENIEKKNTQIYLDSCIAFIYAHSNKNITSFLNEIVKLDTQDFENTSNNEKTNQFLSELTNIKVITSDICGLGKSEKIKNIIKMNGKEHFHFPLGGILTKDIIFKKLENLLKKIKGTKNEDYKKVAIHLDLMESKEESIINEFFFSILITKFYTNNESIIYVPQDIDIYIEIPNCFSNYLSKFRVLKIFNKENITLENMPKFNYPIETTKIFERMLGIKTNEEVQKFVQEFIGCEKYSYHQINIFIKLFISQYSKFEKKLRIKINGKDVTEDCITEFAKCTQYFTNGAFAKLLTGTYKNNNDEHKDYFDKLSEIYQNDLKNMKFPDPLIFITEDYAFDKLYIPSHDSDKYKNSKDYLTRMKKFLNLPNDVENEENGLKSLLSIIEEKDNNYVITNDNFKKMILLVYRIKANIPVIIMGDTGCGKTALIIKLNQLLNNGETKVEIINIHPGITDDKLSKIMEKKNEIAQKKKDEELWIFFDEINTCLSLSLLTEIFINRTYNGNSLSDNIRLIGACNPYRKRKENTEKFGLSMSDDNDNELVYLVEPLPQSLLYYVFSFGSIDDKDEKKYIHSIIEPLFSPDEKFMHKITTEAISQCHIYLRKLYDPSVVSLREIARFSKCIQYFQKYFIIKNNYEQTSNNEKNNKLRSIICSIYLNYYIRLTDAKVRTNFEFELRPILLKLVNNNDLKAENEGGALMDQIKNDDLRFEIMNRPKEQITNFSDFLKIEEEYVLDQIELDEGIGKNTLLKENVFLFFLSVNTNIPYIIIGKPGSGKSLSAQLINKSMRGKYSKNKFFQKFPQIIQTYFQGSESTQPEDVENLFEKAKKKLDYFKNKDIKKEELPISLVLFDELGLAERSKSNPLKVLHSKLEYTGKDEGLSFVGISNYSLDAAKINRALVSSVPDLDQKLGDLIETSTNIVESISDKLKNDKIFEIISHTYFKYKEELQIIKELVVYKQFVIEKRNIENNEKSKNDKNNDKTIDNISEGLKPKEDKLKGKEGLNEGKVGKLNEYSEDINLKDNLIKKDKSESEGKPQDEMNTIMTESGEKAYELIKDNKREKRQFSSIKGDKLYKYLLKKENKIRKDFHGNRDFYNLIKGIAKELAKKGDSNDKDKISIIIRYIERNFGGIDYEIDVDLKLILDDIIVPVKLLKKILEDYDLYEENKKTKLPSVFLFKKLYNIECEELDPNSKLMIEKDKLNDYNLNRCINENIRDENSRYLLLKIKPSLTRLIYRKIELQHPFKKIELYDGSPFINDNNKEYRFKKINEIQDDAKKDKLIIIENLDQIHPFLFDLYNMNYIIKDEKKYARICLEVFNEQLTLVDDKFRIIILVNERFVDKCNLAFLNRLEKINLSFNKLLDNQLKRIADNLIEEMKLKNTIKKYKNVNYSLKDLLINSEDEEIQGLVYYFSQESKNNEDENNDELKEANINEKQLTEQLKEKVFDKIYKVLPQDIISILPEDNIIKQKYCEMKNIYNFEDYINDEENKKYKITIIYTYTGITNIVNGLNKGMSFMVSEVKSEDSLKNLINEIKIKNKNNQYKEGKTLYIKFEQSNSEKIKFISNYILNYLKDDGYNYIFTIHINRNFNTKKRERIYSLPDIYLEINQLFIDNLIGNNNMKLNMFLTRDIKEILEEKREDMKLEEEFKKTLIKYLTINLNKTTFDNNIIKDYINEIQNYFDEDESIKEKIFEITLKLIDMDKEEETNCMDIIEEIYNNNHITIYTIDIVTCFIDYIKENIFNKYLKKVFEILEDNNIITTILEIKKDNFKYINQNLLEELINKFLDEAIKMKKDNYKPKFLFNYNVPGLYNFYIKISDYVNKKVTSNYSNNERKLRKLIKEDFEKIKEFHNIEESLLNNTYDEIKNNDKFIFEIINKIPNELIFNDYITYYLQNHINSAGIYPKDDINHKIINLLLQLRFNENTSIIKENDNINNLLIKIIWIESNVNYILNILKIFDNALAIFNNKENILYNKIVELILKEKSIRYIIDEKKNPEHTKEVNECFYIILASICYVITSDEIQLVEITDNIKDKKDNEIEIDYYSNILFEIFKILQFLNDDLRIFLNEMYIIDELIKIIEIFKNENNIEKINKIKNNMRENADIIQKFANINNFLLSEKLVNNFEELYNLIIKEETENKNNKDYYDNLRYIFYKEIKKISDINYRYKIFEKILEIDEIIKKSNDIFQILLKNILKKEEFENIRNNLLSSDDSIIKLIEKKLNENNFILSETLLYFFEKNSIIYLNYILNHKDVKLNLEDEEDKDKKIKGPFQLLKDSIEFLNYYVFKPEKVASKSKEICKLFCLGYIRVYCYTFIKMLNDEKPKMKDSKKIINILNGNDSLYKMIRLYIYKILYNKETIYAFIQEDNFKKYKLNEYVDLSKLLQNNEFINIYKIDYKIKTLKEDYYEKSYKAIEKCKKEEFKNKIKARDFNIEEIGIDNFYVLSYNLALANLQMENSDINKDFYNNICLPLFQKGTLLFKGIQLFYDPSKFKKIKESFNINPNNIKALLSGYRFCLNELSSPNTRGIYYPLYDGQLKNLKEKFFPGNDTKRNKIYYKIVNHLKNKPNDGCYVCLCDKGGYYHSVASGFPGIGDLNKTCPKCLLPVGSSEKGYFQKDIQAVKREKYYRIVKDEKEIEKLKKNKINKEKLKEINIMTLEQYKTQYIYKTSKNEKGIYISASNDFKSDEKIIRNLSPISYRLLNYILFTHLFFARLITEKNEFNKYLPGLGNRKMSWVDTLSECWNLLKKELLKEYIDSIEKFINYSFIDLFPILNKEKNIDNYDDLIKFEEKLENKIQGIIKKFKEENYKNDIIKKKNEADINSFINLLKEKYTSDYYKSEEFPFYDQLYYSDYLNEIYINEKLKHVDDNKYPLLKYYLDKIMTKKSDEDKYSLVNLNIFNNALNLINGKYYNNISRKLAENRKLKEEQIYVNNKELIDNFIKFYNSLELNDNNKKITLSSDYPLKSFFVDNNDNIGSTYISIYRKFIDHQNESLENLLDIKIEKGIFDINCKNRINIQNINDNEIFTLKLPEKVSFIEILFNSSYKKILDSESRSYELYKEYEINYDLIEENLSEYLLKNKKLLNDNITEFIYNNESFSNQVSNVLSLFKMKYTIKNLILDDKVAIYKFYEPNKNNINICKNIINDFLTLINFLNDKRKEGENKEYTEDSKLYDVALDIKDTVTNFLIKIFEGNETLTVNKTLGIFDYYLKLIFENIVKEIEDYQDKLDKNTIENIKKYKFKDDIISKKDLAIAIRIFITLVLVPEEEKEKKIKMNNNNVINYLRESDLWKNDIKDVSFNKALNELKIFNVKINQIISLYKTLGKDIEDNFGKDVEEYINALQKKEQDNDPFANNEEGEEEEEEDKKKDENRVVVNKDENEEEESEDDIFAAKDKGSEDGNESD